MKLSGTVLVRGNKNYAFSLLTWEEIGLHLQRVYTEEKINIGINQQVEITIWYIHTDIIQDTGVI